MNDHYMGKRINIQYLIKKVLLCILSITIIYIIVSNVMVLYAEQCFYKEDTKIIYDVKDYISHADEAYVSNGNNQYNNNDYVNKLEF